MTKKILSSDDSDLFRQWANVDKPLKTDTVPVYSENKPRPYPKDKIVAAGDGFSDFLGDQLDKLYQEDSVSFLAPGLQKNTLKKLRKGFFGLDAEIDLHGLTSREARKKLSHFLQDNIESGSRCVHIIHGKGYRSSDNQPVLKNDVNLWLRQHNEVQAFCSTQAKHGGTGAVFVLLKLTEKYKEQGNT
ncbi:MAG: Smr/MutS family protein [Methylococcales bacterium]|nr:Smr/MutS family protein [Methylococcales bacterium]